MPFPMEALDNGRAYGYYDDKRSYWECFCGRVNPSEVEQCRDCFVPRGDVAAEILNNKEKRQFWHTYNNDVKSGKRQGQYDSGYWNRRKQ